MTAAECAASLGLSVDRFNRKRAELIACDDMPASTCSVGWYRPDRASWLAWRGRYHPHAPAHAAANDTAPPADEVTQARERIATRYATR